MRRRATAGRKPAKTRRRKHTRPKRRSVTASQSKLSVSDLQERHKRQARELEEARDERAAIGDVLRIISSSPGELQAVFQAILTNAVRICEANFGDLYLREADGFRMAASHNAPPAYVEARTRELVLRPPPDTPLGRIAATKQLVQIADIKTIPSYIEDHPFVRAAVQCDTGHNLAAGWRALQAGIKLRLLSRVRGVLQAESNFSRTDTGNRPGTNRAGR